MTVIGNTITRAALAENSAHAFEITNPEPQCFVAVCKCGWHGGRFPSDWRAERSGLGHLNKRRTEGRDTSALTPGSVPPEVSRPPK